MSGEHTDDGPSGGEPDPGNWNLHGTSYAANDGVDEVHYWSLDESSSEYEVDFADVDDVSDEASKLPANPGEYVPTYRYEYVPADCAEVLTHPAEEEPPSILRHFAQCPDCSGKGQVALLVSVSACKRCGGSGWTDV